MNESALILSDNRRTICKC